MKSCTDIHGSQRTKTNDCGDPLAFPVVVMSEIAQKLWNGLL